MAEVKNNFLKSKMNKDLDDRIIPNGEYRDAQNIGISKSESSDVGALENVLGNSLASSLGLSVNCGITVIGNFMDNVNNRMIIFVTDYTDSSANRLSNFAPSTSTHQIICYYPSDNTVNILAQGHFLNFSKTHPVYGVNLLEDLLFWTDDRNQPRTLNVNAAESNTNWYTTEDSISVCKYYPWKPIRLYRDSGIPVGVQVQAGGSGYANAAALNTTGGTGTGLTVNISTIPPVGPAPINSATIQASGSGYTNGDIVDVVGGGGTGGKLTVATRLDSTMLDVVSPNLPDANVSTATVLTGGTGYSAGTESTTGGSGSGLTVAITVAVGAIISASIVNPGSGYVNGDVVAVSGGTNGSIQLTVTSTPNPYYDANWPGDPDYLKNRFVRFSYRFRFEDGQYSLIAPFTQIAFVPEQDGYFLANDENRTYISTEVGFMRNKINDISLMIDSPEGYPWANLRYSLKVIEMDILYKESDELPIRIIETIPFEEFGDGIFKGNTVFEYKYQSRKPIKVLPESEIIRTSDKVPVRALAQEVVGNRVVYANYLDKHSSPDILNYNVLSSTKDNETAATPAYTHKEYQNSTLKQNRTYQVGIVLCDKYGRQSDVILSSANSSISVNDKGDTIFHAYKSGGFSDSDLISNTTTWPGDSLKVSFNSLIPSAILNDPGYPGLYSLENPLGYYTYKVVVKQTEQGYYNVYFPGILNGGSDNLGGVEATATDPTGYIILTGDNINKIPKDLKDVGPNQNQFRSGRPTYEEDPSYYEWDAIPLTSGDIAYGLEADLLSVSFNDRDEQGLSVAQRALLNRRDRITGKRTKNANVILYGRVTNFTITSTVNLSNKRINPGTTNDVVTAIGTVRDLALADSTGEVDPELYSYKSNPFAARIELTDISLGSTENDLTTNPLAELAIYETEPFDSALDIYWETSTSGLISELNNAIGASDLTIPVSLDTPSVTSYDEYTNLGGSATSTFYARDNNGSIIPGATMVLSSVENSSFIGNNVSTNFSLVSDGGGGYHIATATHQYYTNDNKKNKFTGYIQVTNGANVEFFSVNFKRTNLSPNITNKPAPSGLIADYNGGLIYTFLADNGARDASVNKKELTWELVSQKEYNILTAQTGADVNVFYGSSTTEGQYILSNNFVAPNYWSSTLNASLFSYIVKIKVTDGGGLSDETEFIVRTPA
jgi:hypothetical protein